MTTINKSELKGIAAAMKRSPFAPPGAVNSSGLRIAKNRRAAGKMAESVARKVGLDVSRINHLLEEDQKAVRGVFDHELVKAAKGSRAAEAAFRSGMLSRLQALQLLAVPFTSTLVNLDKPVLIWQLPNPQLDIFIDSEIASMNSSVKTFVNVIDGSRSTRFVFFYLWRNDSDFFAVANVRSSLIVNGACSVQAKPGIFSGDVATLNLAASMILMRWSGWGMDPVTGESNDQTPHPEFQQTQRQNITSLRAEGGHIFQGADFTSQSFVFEPFPLSHHLFVVPGKAVTVFQISLEVFYDFDGGGDIQDNVFVDFSKNGNGVFCPNVELEILTPLPIFATKRSS